MKYGYILIVILFKVSGSAGSYFVSEISSLWAEKDNNCSIAYPPIHYTKSGITVEINSTLISTGGDAWVGYIKNQKIFDYIGCFKPISLNMNRIEKVKVGSPRECFDLCSPSSIIGLSVDECYCIKDSSSLMDFPSTYEHCTTECKTGHGLACGNKTENGTDYISVYKDTQIDSTCVPTSSNWEHKPWIGNVNSCFSHGGSPMRAKSCSGKNFSRVTDTQAPKTRKYYLKTEPVWTSYIRSYCISSSKKTSVESGIQYGYVQNDGGRIVLKFTTDDSEKKRILCTNQNMQSLTESNRQLSLLVLIAIVVSAVFAAIAVIMIFTVVLWCRRKSRQRHKRNNMPHGDNTVVSFISNANYACIDDTIGQIGGNKANDAYQQVDDKYLQNTNVAVKRERKSPDLACRKDEHDKKYSTYDCIDDIVCKPGFSKNDDKLSSVDTTVHNYYILEKTLQQDKQSKYDITQFSKKTSIEGDAKIYNKLTFEKEQTYDHAFQRKPTVCHGFADTYNTIAAVHNSTQKN